MTGTHGVLVWLIAAGLLLALEGVTTQLVSIWFAVGALVAAIPAFFGAAFWVQLLVFLASSILFLYFIRPVLRQKIMVKKQPTNADMVVGATGLVLEEIDNLRLTGRVSANGLDWTARSESGVVIPARSQVRVERIEGVKIIVTPLITNENQGGND